jgi:hypothetical protein
MVMASAIFLLEIFRNSKEWLKIRSEWCGVRYVIEREKKIPERRSGLRPSENDYLERRSSAFCHKKTSHYGNEMCILTL